MKSAASGQAAPELAANLDKAERALARFGGSAVRHLIAESMGSDPPGLTPTET